MSTNLSLKSKCKETNLLRKRVVITGLGLLTPAGGCFETYWETITQGHSVLRPISRVNTDDLSFKLVGEVDDSLFSADELPKEFEKVDRALLLCRVASRRALKDAGLETSENNRRHIGLILGTGGGPTEAAEESFLVFAGSDGATALPPRTVTRTMFNSISSHVGIDLKLTGPQLSIASACSSANIAMSRAVDLIRYGKIKQVVTGGVEMPLCRSALASWSAMRVCSKADDKNKCLLPFDSRRSGLALSEGSVMYVFEELESAQSRGAHIYAEILGYGESNDATHIIQPDSTSQSLAIQQGLDDAGIGREEVDYINAHGTGTKLNDLSETEAIKKCFGDRAYNIPISSTKSVIGHALGASGALELPAILGAFKHQVLPPTANLYEPDQQCDLDYVPCKARNATVNIAISNSFAFGGSNSVLVLEKF